MLEGGCSHCTRVPIELERATRSLHERRQQAKPKHLSNSCIMDAHLLLCFTTNGQFAMHVVQFICGVWGTVCPLSAVPSRRVFLWPAILWIVLHPPLLCYNCIFIHNLQRVCWQQQLVSHSCRGGDSNLILARPLCSPKLCQCFPELFQASNSLQKPFLNLIRCLFICQLRLGYL